MHFPDFPLLLQPLLKNSIIHGFKDGQENCISTIRIEKSDDMLVCKIEDNGIGFHFSEEKIISLSHHQSFGLELTEKRIRLLNTMYSPKGTIVFYNLPERGACVEIKLPFQTEF